MKSAPKNGTKVVQMISQRPKFAPMLNKILSALNPSGCRLVAVSKTQSVEAIEAMYRQGQKIFGESRPQEMLEKRRSLPSDIEWHMIGHLQTNKVKYLAPFVSLIHSVDSLKLLEEIDRQALKHGRSQDCLLQFHIAQEDTKYGLSEQEAEALLSSESFSKLANVRICGVMGMATFTDDRQQVRNEFKSLRQIFERLKSQFFPHNDYFREISMGMSSDWQIAVEEGSTLVRIGTLLFSPKT
jgi:pyridoxal phosphate enzyme (YggS family)